MAVRSVMRRTLCGGGGGNIAARYAAPGKLARTAGVARSGPPKTRGATHYYIVFLSTLARFIFSPTQTALALPTAPAVQTLTRSNGAPIMAVWIWGWCIAASWENFFSRAVGWLPRRKIFSGIFAGTLAPPAAIRYSSFVGWSLVSQS
jgi:hypothetical protein